MKNIKTTIDGFDQEDIAAIELNKGWQGNIEGTDIELTLEDFEIQTDDIPGWFVANDAEITLALDVTLSDELREEGIARELVNRIQNIRKDSGFEVTDKILLTIKSDDRINNAVKNNLNYICSETLAHDLSLQAELTNQTIVELDADLTAEIAVALAN